MQAGRQAAQWQQAAAAQETQDCDGPQSVSPKAQVTASQPY
jgi:hypothetical protein